MPIRLHAGQIESYDGRPRLTFLHISLKQFTTGRFSWHEICDMEGRVWNRMSSGQGGRGRWILQTSSRRWIWGIGG